MREWERDKELAHTCDERIDEILMLVIGGPIVSTDTDPAYRLLDEQNATDRIAAGKHVAVRVRNPGEIWKRNYADEFTIRYLRPERQDGTRSETEFSKIMAGCGDYSFYGFKSQDHRGLIKWTLYDLRVFREHIQNLSRATDATHEQAAYSLAEIIENHNGDSKLAAFKWSDFPPDMILAEGDARIECPTCQGQKLLPLLQDCVSCPADYPFAGSTHNLVPMCSEDCPHELTHRGTPECYWGTWREMYRGPCKWCKGTRYMPPRKTCTTCQARGQFIPEGVKV